MENILNIYHYSLYLMHYRLHLLVNRVNPFILLHKLPMQKRKYKELGIDIDKEVDKAFGNKKFGLSILVSGGLLLVTIFLSIFILLQLLIRLLDIELIFGKYIYIVIVALSFGICYIFVFYKDKYMPYFDRYEKLKRKEQNRYIIFSMLYITLISFLFFVSLLY